MISISQTSSIDGTASEPDLPGGSRAIEILIAENSKLRAEISISTARNYDILECISEAFFTLDVKWRFSYANGATERLLGRRAAEFLGKSVWDEYPGLLGSDFEPIYREAMDQRREGRITEWYPDHRRWYEVNVFPASKGVTVCFKDVTELRKVEDEVKSLAERNRNILESITDSFLALDEDWKYTYLNPQAEVLTGKKCDELLGKSIWEEFPGLAGSRFETAYRRTASERVTTTLTAFYPDHDRWYEINAYPAPRGITIYFRDVTTAVRSEEKLRLSDQKKDEFLATLAHELRNPLAPIRSGVEMLRRLRKDEEKFNKTIDIVERQTRQLIHLVDDLLEISRITQGKIELRKKRIDLKTAIDVALDTSQPLIEDAKNDLTVSLPSEPIYLDADPTRLAQVLLNILNNAAKYSDPGGKISLIAKSEDGEAVISIKDTGLGIGREKISKIFEMFDQVNGPDGIARGGLGIGLSVVKKLVEMHGGTVQAMSDGIGKGSEFVVRLPLAVRVNLGAAEQVEMSTSQRPTLGDMPAKFKILVVDDNLDAAEMLEMFLSLNGHTVRTSRDAETALDTAGVFGPDICLCDIGLPGMSGFELAPLLREMLPAARLISISGWGQEKDIRRSMEVGFDYHLLKPVEFEDLLDLIQLFAPRSAQTLY